MSTELVMLVRSHGVDAMVAMDPVTQTVLWTELFNEEARQVIQDGIEADMRAIYGESNTRFDKVTAPRPRFPLPSSW